MLSQMPPEGESALLTDLYQLTMMQAYFDAGMHGMAVFEFFVRKLPPARNFLVAAGLDQALEYLETLRISPAELEWLGASGRFDPSFLDWLSGLHFDGDVDALPEGTVFFADEPLLRVVAPLPVAQLVESRLINLLQYPTMVASKAVRCVLAAPGRTLVDFGMRRAHGAEAALLSARASHLAGFDGTATVLAGLRWDIPLFGTMAHSFIQAHDDELAAFEHFARSHPQANTLLIDTYDTEAAAARLPALARRLQAQGIAVQAVRIDSGDLGAHAHRVRAILDAGGLPGVRIFVSGNLDEDRIDELLASGAPIDGFGVGTRMNTVADQPWLDCAYKLQEYAGHARRKRSEGKATWPGRKQVFRRYGAHGIACEDVLATLDEPCEGTALLQPAMRGGRRLDTSSGRAQLVEARQRLKDQLATLPPHLLDRAASPEGYPVRISKGLQTLTAAIDAGSALPDCNRGGGPP